MTDTENEILYGYLQIENILFMIHPLIDSSKTDHEQTKISLLKSFIENEITQVITDSDILLNGNVQSNTEEEIEFMSFTSSIYNDNYFIDSLNDIVFYLKTPLQKTALFLSMNDSISESINFELFLILSYIMQTRNLKLKEASDYLLDIIAKQIEDSSMLSFEATEYYIDTINKLRGKLEKYKNSIQENKIDEQLIKYEKECFKEVEFYYKCAQCRHTLFTNVEIDDYHQYTPKLQYSFKGYKKSFVRNNNCSSYFLKDVESTFCNNKYLNPKDKLKVTYTVNEFYSKKQNVKLSCLKCGIKIGEYSPTGMQCSCGSWVVPSCQIVKSKLDKVPLKFDLFTMGNVTKPSFIK